MKKIKVLLIEDSYLLREGILKIIKKQKDIALTIATGDGKNGCLIPQRLKPDVVLIDSALQNQNCLKVIDAAKKGEPELKIIVINLTSAETEILQYVIIGSNGFILKDASSSDFIKTIKAVANGLTVLPAQFVNPLFSQIVQRAAVEAKSKLNVDVLMTKREQEVIELLGNGLSNKEISQKINLSKYTVKSHIHNIMEKLGIHTRLEIANYSYLDENFRSISKRIQANIN